MYSTSNASKILLINNELSTAYIESPFSRAPSDTLAEEQKEEQKEVDSMHPKYSLLSTCFHRLFRKKKDKKVDRKMSHLANLYRNCTTFTTSSTTRLNIDWLTIPPSIENEKYLKHSSLPINCSARTDDSIRRDTPSEIAATRMSSWRIRAPNTTKSSSTLPVSPPLPQRNELLILPLSFTQSVDFRDYLILSDYYKSSSEE